jgi:hypothetical protein
MRSPKELFRPASVEVVEDAGSILPRELGPANPDLFPYFPSHLRGLQALKHLRLPLIFDVGITVTAFYFFRISRPQLIAAI